MPQQAAEEIILKTKIAIAAMFTAAALLTSAQASTTLTTTMPTGTLGTSANLYLSNAGAGYTGTGNGYIIAYGWDDIFGSTVGAPKYTSPAAAENLKVGTDGGLGLNNSTDNGQIGPNDGIVLDFANVQTTLGGGSISQVTINFDKDNTGASSTYMLYGFTTADGTGTAVLVASGSMATSGPVTYNTSGSPYLSYVLGLDSGCSLDVQSISVAYNTTTRTPEPGTFLMAGIALIGLGVTMKKRGRKV